MSKKREPYEIFSVHIEGSNPVNWEGCTDLSIAPQADIIQFLTWNDKPVVIRTKETVIITYEASPPSSDIIVPPAIVVPQH